MKTYYDYKYPEIIPKQNKEKNFNITNRIFEVLNQIKEFEVAMSNPKHGIIICRYENIDFEINISTLYTSEFATLKGKQDFSEIVKANNYRFGK